MIIARILIAAIAGYVFVRAAGRWTTTIRVLGVGRAISGASTMWSIRCEMPFHAGGDQALVRWPIRPTVPLLFELQVFAAALVILYFADASMLGRVLTAPIIIAAAIWAVAHAAESVIPPCLLYLGVSEPGQFENFRYLASSRRWLAMSALDQGNPSVGGGDTASGSFFRSLLPNRIRGVPLGLLFQRRRLESIRTSNNVWESAIRRLSDFVPLIIVDLRSHSAIVSNEFMWALEAGAASRLLVITRDDRLTSVDLDLEPLGRSLSSIVRTVIEDELNGVVATLLDHPPTGTQAPTTEVDSTAGVSLGNAIRTATEQKRALLERLVHSRGPDRTIDRDFNELVGGPSCSVPPFTASLVDAVRLLRRRLPKCSYTIHVGRDKTVWADIGVQPIARSFRVSVSGMKPVDHAAKAILAALLNAELGHGWGRGQRQPYRLRPLGFPADRVDDEASTLIQRACSYGEQRDLQFERQLLEAFGVDSATLSSDGEQAIVEELNAAIAAVQEPPLFSLSIDVSLDNRGLAGVAEPSGSSWFVALSGPFGKQKWMRPSVALLIATLKAKHQLFDGRK
jgi:hypothetical protein